MRTLTILVVIATFVGSSTARAEDAGVRGDSLSSGAPSLRAMAGHIMVEVTPTAARLRQVYVLAAGDVSPDEPVDLSALPSGDGGPSRDDGGLGLGDSGPTGSGAEGDRGRTPWIALPENAREVRIERGEELIRTVAGGFALSDDSVAPGRHAIAFSFVIPAEEGNAVIAHRLPFPVGSLHVMWVDGAPFSAQAMGFTDRGRVDMGPRRMRILERANFRAGSRLVIVTSNRPTPTAAPESAEEPTTGDPLATLRPVTLILAALILLAGLLLPLTGRWPRSK